MKALRTLVPLVLTMAAGCGAPVASHSPPSDIPAVQAVAETEPVHNPGDAADDPAIWIHPDDPGRSTVIGTDKRGGIAVYDLTGKELHRYADGEHNNVDVRYGFQLAGRPTDLVVSSDRASRTIRVYAVDVDSRGLVDVAPGGLRLAFEPYGLCLYDPVADGRLYAFVTGSDPGFFQQWELVDAGDGGIAARYVQSLPLQGPSEGCVTDDSGGWVYVAEEDVGIWRYDASPRTDAEGVLIDQTVAEGGERLFADIEGLALYHTADGARYLLASSQGRSIFVVYEVQPFRYIGAFAVTDGAVDGVTHTDGIDVTSVPLGGSFGSGLFVAQDDDNEHGNQTFKLVPWQAIADVLDLDVDPGWSPRG